MDNSLLECLRFTNLSSSAPDPTQPRVLHHSTGRIDFGLRELDIMSSQTALLNDVCLNGIATLLFDRFSRSTDPASDSTRCCALFDTYHLPMVRYNATDENLWRRTRSMEYWSKDVWIIPIHRPSTTHWVLCCVSLPMREIRLFDSFAQRASWKHEIKEIMILITHLVLIANKHGCPLHIVTEEGWTAHPISVECVQTNGVDCGLWVLATITAILRGYHAAGLAEGDMSRFRTLLLDNILVLPLAK